MIHVSFACKSSFQIIFRIAPDKVSIVRAVYFLQREFDRHLARSGMVSRWNVTCTTLTVIEVSAAHEDDRRFCIPQWLFRRIVRGVIGNAAGILGEISFDGGY